MAKLQETKKPQETCVLVGIVNKRQNIDVLTEYLDELAFLATTADAFCVKRYWQNLDHPDNRTFVGSGKIQEIKDFVFENEVDMVIFDDELSPSQLRNLENLFNDDDHKVKILDRNNLILDIFAARAQTAHAKVQVELAQYEYLLPRLTRMWTHLERQKGGIGMRGPGELQIETDRRIIRDRIAKLKEDLKIIDRQKTTQRGNRGAMVRVALVGYTNVGKSTIMNMMSKSEVLAENKLFATLDTTVRKVVVKNLPLLLSDTVGFIRKLPHQLIESFKSTLDEVRESDLLVHVVDISHPQFEDHYKVVMETLQEIGAGDKPMILAFNKVDAYSFIEKDEDDLTPKTAANFSLEELKESWMARMGSEDVVFMSAAKKIQIEEFREILYDRAREIHIVRFPYNDFLFDDFTE
ncbi:MAG: GTPase HflX [Flavobacteriales bacterium]|jgi:GTPase|nr:GTPase HflX [Flavobacteriales bacterium]MDP4818068.1 GTPase HflX [Flavobacteriales bacterium]MDP4951202.1 GTPase HflX [Flavobacteriales bacterium]